MSSVSSGNFFSFGKADEHSVAQDCFAGARILHYSKFES